MALQFIGEKKLQANIRSIAKTGAKLSALIHETAVQALIWACSTDKDGNIRNDARPMDQLLKALPKGTRVEGFKLWVQMFSPIRWNGDGKVGVLKETAKTYTKYDVDGANATPFWDATKENQVKKLSPEALMKLVNQYAENILSASDDGVVYDKAGEPRFALDGNVVELKTYAQEVKTALNRVTVPTKTAPQATEKLIPGAVKSAQENAPSSPVAVTNAGEAQVEPMKSAAA